MRYSLFILILGVIIASPGCSEKSNPIRLEPIIHLTVSWSLIPTGADTVQVQFNATVKNWMAGYGISCNVEVVTSSGSSSTVFEGLYMQEEVSSTLTFLNINSPDIWFPYVIVLKGPPLATTTVQSSSGTYRP